VGKTGYDRQITHVAAGTDDYDAVNVLQLEGAVSAATADAVTYDDASHTSVTLGGVGAAAPVTLTNVAGGSVAAGSTDAVNGGQLYSVQQIANNANQGWNVTTGATGSGVANGPTVANIAPGSTATLLADNNIITTQTGAAVAIGVNPVLTGLTSIAFATGGPVITGGGIDMGDTRITNLAPAQDATDAVTLEQMDTTIAGATANAVTYDDATHATVTLGGVGAAAPVTLTNVADGNVAAGSTDAVNGGQLYSVQQIANNANQGWNVTTAATGTGIVNGTTVANVAPGGTTTLLADNNIIATQTGAAVAFGVNPVLTGLTSIAFATGGPVISSGGIDMGGTRVTNMAAAQADSDAVTLAQVDALTNNGAAALTSHYFKANGPADGSDDAVDTGAQAIAVGSDASASGDFSVALGVDAVAPTRRAIAIGQQSVASGAQAFALGTGASATGNNSVALGGAIDKNANGIIDPGEFASATGGLSMAMGSAAQATQDNATAIGGESQASGVGATAVGSTSVASGLAASTLGFGAQATGDESVAIGYLSQATAQSSVAIGWNSIADAANTVSVGSTGNYRRIVNVADPTGAHDAVTLGYLQSNYSTTNALASLSQQIDALDKQMANLNRASVSEPAAAPTAVAAADSPAPVAASSQTQQAVASANAYTDQQTQEALQSANTYAQAQGAQAVSAAKAYTDAALANYVTTDTFNQYQQQVNARFSQQDERIDRTSAMSTAMVQMAASAAGIDTPNRVGIGVGSTHGESALAVGYQRAIGKNATFTIGGSASSGESTVGAGVGFGW
jgi:autotransporter adhesin